VDRGLTCRELVELVTDYLEGALAAGERERFEAHMSACEGCDAHVEQVRRAIELTGRTRALERRPEIAALTALFHDFRRGV
jgi:anti-sigma factor RsiW